MSTSLRPAPIDLAKGTEGARTVQTVRRPSPVAKPLSSSELPDRAWIEINTDRLRRNYELICQHKAAGVKLLSVVKDDGYGHGAEVVAGAALAAGAEFLALATVEEAVRLRDRGIRCKILLLGDRHSGELPWCIDSDLTCCVSEAGAIHELAKAAARAGIRVPVHLKINTGMNRYGVRWDCTAELAEEIRTSGWLYLEGALTHFAQSEDADKTFALLQLSRFQEALEALTARGVVPELRHACNSGGFLDLPQAHFEMVRLGILGLGVFPSPVCKRIPGIEPVMAVKARVAAIQRLEAGDSVGYGMRYTASSPRRIALLPIGYGDGYPRASNQGCALIQGQRAPIVGMVSMDAISVDITHIRTAQVGDVAVLMGEQGDEEISVHDIALLKNSIAYDVFTSWRARLPRIYVGNGVAPAKEQGSVIFTAL